MKALSFCSAALLLVAPLITGGCKPAGTEPRAESADGLAALAASATGFSSASPETTLQFPEDHGEHRDYRIEWWYLTANLEDDAGRQFGAQWTLFRVAVEPQSDGPPANPWQDSQVYMAHFAISTDTEHVARQRYARGGTHGGLARAGVEGKPFRAWLDDWYLGSRAAADQQFATTGGFDLSSPRTVSDGWLPLEVFAQENGYSIDLQLRSERNLVLQGNNGFSKKHPNGGGSHYYSHPFLEASGELEFAGERFEVHGQAWLDREWSSQFLQADQTGWDWFALHLDSGEKLMLFQLRGKTKGEASFRHGVLISAEGGTTEIDARSIALEPTAYAQVAGRRLPIRWQIDLASLNRSLSVTALHKDQWLDVDFAYWEGFVHAEGASPEESGRGYLEMVGYPSDR
ncbi:MAG: lipocalin-like domain-containing protein [Pseudomonadota bacterium]